MSGSGSVWFIAGVICCCTKHPEFGILFFIFALMA